MIGDSPMMVRLPLITVIAALASLPAAAQEVMPAAKPPPSCSADKLDANMTRFIGPEDQDSAPPQVALAESGSIVGSLPPPAAAMRQREEAFGH